MCFSFIFVCRFSHSFFVWNFDGVVSCWVVYRVGLGTTIIEKWFTSMIFIWIKQWHYREEEGKVGAIFFFHMCSIGIHHEVHVYAWALQLSKILSFIKTFIFLYGIMSCTKIKIGALQKLVFIFYFRSRVMTELSSFDHFVKFGSSQVAKIKNKN